MSCIGRPDLSVAADVERSFIGGLMREFEEKDLWSEMGEEKVFVAEEAVERG